ncbi:MAG: 1-acyl-sn-glycerol-3-phosphate acyltransferase [bacterium]|nr:1-acyl-sn-glycerol-3-phosphate acyltransferase [bacterium]
MEFFVKSVDWFFGTILRSLVRNIFVHPFFLLNYRVTIDDEQKVLSAVNGAVVVANHVSLLDGPFLANEFWPYARLRPTVWHAEYTDWLKWPIMKLFGAVCLGSPKHLPEEERHRRKAKSIRIMNKILDAGHPLLIFAEGGIGDGVRVSIPPHYSGAHDVIARHPGKPVFFVRIIGLEFSAFGKRRSRRHFFRRLPVSIVVTRVEHVSLEGGPAGLNLRMERFFNDGTPVATDT